MFSTFAVSLRVRSIEPVSRNMTEAPLIYLVESMTMDGAKLLAANIVREAYQVEREAITVDTARLINNTVVIGHDGYIRLRASLTVKPDAPSTDIHRYGRVPE